MVISNVNQVVYDGDGITVAWPFTFRIIEASDIKLTIIEADGTETDVTSDYYVNMVNNTVYYPGYAPGSEPPLEDQPQKLQTGQKLVVYRELPITQEKDLGELWPFAVIELALDKLTMILQQIFGIWDRCFKVSVGTSVEHPNFDMNVPIEAGKSFRVNNDGTGFEVVDSPSDAVAAAQAAQAAAEYAQGQAEDAKDAAEDAKEDADDAAARAEAVLTEIDDMTVGYANMAEMIADDNLVDGMTTITKGYYSINDGGAGVYHIRTKIGTDTDNGGTIIFLANDLVAELVIKDSINVRTFGAKGNGTDDDTSAFSNAVAAANNKTLIVPSGTYKITSAVIAAGVKDVEDYGTYNNIKPVYPATELMFKGFRDMERIGKLAAVSGYVGQGMCYNSTTDRYLVGLATEDNTSQKILVVKPSDLSVTATQNFSALGHVNSLTYVPDTDEIVVATGRNNWKNISIVNASTYAVKQEVVNVLGGESILAIKYDPICKVYFAFSHNSSGTYYYYILDTSFTIIRSGTFSGPSDTSNGLVAYNGTALIYMFAAIIEVDYLGNVKHVTNHQLRWEFEDADMTPYGIITSANSGGVGYSMFRYKENTIQMSDSLFPISIETYNTVHNTDLNLLRNAGQYIVSTQNFTPAEATAYHYPSNVYNGFLTVFRVSTPISNGFVKQILYRIGDGDAFNSNNWQVYTRQYDPTNNRNTWSNWNRIDSGLVEQGKTAYGSDIPAGSYRDLTINFTVPFKAVPHVQLTMFSTSTSMDYANLTLVIYDVTTTKLVVRCFNGGSGGRAPGVWWRATER